MFKFVLVKYNYLKGITAWQLLVENLIDLHNYMEATSKTLVNDYWETKRRLREGYHLNDRQEVIHWTLGMCKQKRSSIIDDLNILTDLRFKPKMDAIFKGKRLLINSVGGWCFIIKGQHEILDTIENDKFIYPYYMEKNITIHLTKLVRG